MSHKTIGTINVTLDARGINSAIREIQHIQRQLSEAMEKLVRELASQGADVARIQVAAMEAVDTGELEHSIYGYYDPESRIGYVVAGAPHAFYVEYGTGVIGARNPHPEAGKANWQYAIGEHIRVGPRGQIGWWYIKGSDGVFSGSDDIHWTQGQPSRPFMYNTLVWLEEAAEALGRTILS